MWKEVFLTQFQVRDDSYREGLKNIVKILSRHVPPVPANRLRNCGCEMQAFVNLNDINMMFRGIPHDII